MRMACMGLKLELNSHRLPSGHTAKFVQCHITSVVAKPGLLEAEFEGTIACLLCHLRLCQKAQDAQQWAIWSWGYWSPNQQCGWGKITCVKVKRRATPSRQWTVLVICDARSLRAFAAFKTCFAWACEGLWPYFAQMAQAQTLPPTAQSRVIRRDTQHAARP
jgi:hypothetical protein